MAVYERTYRGYDGSITPEWSRFLVIPRYAAQQVFASKAFIVFLVLCFLYPLFCGIVIYLPHNLNVLKLFQVTSEQLQGFVSNFFPMQFMYFQGFLAFMLTFFVSPALVSADLRNNGLPLYLSRPFSKTEYVVGKLTILFLLLSAITWVPGLLLFGLQSYLMGLDWLTDNLRMGLAIFVGSWFWIGVLSLLSLAISAHVRWKPIARIVLLGVFFFGFFFGPMINGIFGIDSGRMLMFLDMMRVLWDGMFGAESVLPFPAWKALLSLGTLAAASLFMLAQKIKAYEVIR